MSATPTKGALAAVFESEKSPHPLGFAESLPPEGEERLAKCLGFVVLSPGFIPKSDYTIMKTVLRK